VCDPCLRLYSCPVTEVKVDGGLHAALTGSKRLQLNTQVKVRGGGAGVGSVAQLQAPV